MDDADIGGHMQSIHVGYIGRLNSFLQRGEDCDSVSRIYSAHLDDIRHASQTVGSLHTILT
jgi:hypothetical protein